LFVSRSIVDFELDSRLLDRYGCKRIRNAIFGAAYNSSDLLSFLNYCNDIGMKEIGYALLNYVIGLVTANVHVYYGILGLVVNGIFSMQYTC
jgi:hypothetical protein